MKVLATKIMLLALALTLLLALFVLCPWLPGEPFRNLAAKHAILAATPGRKVILVGGSGVANGLSAGVIEQNLAGYRAVNMGLNAGLGLRFNLAEIREYLKPGDLVVLSPEYENFEGGQDGSVQILKAVNVAPFARKYVEKEQLRHLLAHEWLSLLQLKAQSYFDRLTSIFSGASVRIDDRGDRTSESAVRDVEKMDFDFVPTESSYRECVTILNDFDKFCRNRGAAAFLSYPSLPTVQFGKARREIGKLHLRLSRDVTIAILHPPEENVFDPGYFDDTVYHLGKAGRQIRSRRIAGMLGSRLQSPAAPLAYHPGKRGGAGL